MASPDPALSFGLVDGLPVFMDARDDLYFRLEPEHEQEFIGSLASGGLVPPSSAIAAALGMPRGGTLPAPASMDAPSESLLDRLPPPASLADLLKAAGALARARRQLRKSPIAQLLGRLGDGGPATKRAADGSMIDNAARFASARPYLPFKPHCLSDSLALLDFLGAEAGGAALVFGVKLDPFAAHCWVQSGALLLNDRLDHVERFQPVRIVPCLPATR